MMYKIFLLFRPQNRDKIMNIYSVKHTILVASIIIGLIISTLVSSYAHNTQAGISEKVLRLHIVANSNSKEDQELKLKVRDAIINEMNCNFNISESIEDTKKIAENNLYNIQEIAKRIIAKNNKDYDVDVSIGPTYFPTKYYGNTALPAGDYDALIVKIGSAKGNNWWCVLFPPLCLIDATNGELPQSSKDKLKAELTPEEYKLITSYDDNIEFKLKFKAVEVWQSSKHKVQVAVDDLF